MEKTLAEQYIEDPSNKRLFLQENAIYEITALIEQVMKEEDVTRAQLADRLGRTKGWVTQLLDGEANKTIRTVADVLAVLGRELCAYAPHVSISNSYSFQIVLPMQHARAQWPAPLGPNKNWVFNIVRPGELESGQTTDHLGFTGSRSLKAL